MECEVSVPYLICSLKTWGIVELLGTADVDKNKGRVFQLISNTEYKQRRDNFTRDAHRTDVRFKEIINTDAMKRAQDRIRDPVV